jgi:hypothetical protein
MRTSAALAVIRRLSSSSESALEPRRSAPSLAWPE